MAERATLRRWTLIGAAGLASSLLVASLFTFIGHPYPLRNLAISLIHSAVIGGLAGVTVLPLVTWLHRRQPVVRWAVIILTLLIVAGVGSMVADVVVTTVGLVPAFLYWRIAILNIWIAVVTTLGIGIGLLLYESTRLRLDRTTREVSELQLARARAEKLAGDAQLAALAARVHPHFLFNTLNAIRVLVREDPAHAERLIDRLAGLLRAALDTSERTTVPLGEELALVRSYLDIEVARLGSRLDRTIDVARELHGVPVPPLCLQTLAENAVKHVAAARVQGARVCISARRSDGGVELSVWDDGPIFALDGSPPGHGLHTLRARLTSLYRGAARLDVVPADGGKAVTLRLPA